MLLVFGAGVSLCQLTSAYDSTAGRWWCPLTGNRVWWLLSDFLVVLSQQYWSWTNVDYMLAWCKAYHWFMHMLGWCGTISLAYPKSRLLTQHNQKSLSSHHTLFLMRGWGGWGLEGRVWAYDYSELAELNLSVQATMVWLASTLHVQRTTKPVHKSSWVPISTVFRVGTEIVTPHMADVDNNTYSFVHYYTMHGHAVPHSITTIVHSTY